MTQSKTGLVSFFDDFNRADSTNLGPNWTEFGIGDMSISSNALVGTANFSFGGMGAIYTGKQCSTINQYCKVTLDHSGGQYLYFGLLLRSSGVFDGYSFLIIQEDGATIWSGPQGQIWATSPTSLSYPLILAVTIKGTGDNTELRYWFNVTANAPDSGGETWDGAAPVFTFTQNPTIPNDSGNYIGVIALANDKAPIWDNFYGGDIPGL